MKTKQEKCRFWFLVCDESYDTDEVIEQWMIGKSQADARSAWSLAQEEGEDALSGEDDGAMVAVYVATREDGADAKRFVVTISVSYVVSGGSDGDAVCLVPPTVDEETGEVVKGCADDQTLPLFGG
jgi:hypothetical protein